MEIIDELEPVKRGIYGGAVGYLSFAGDMDLAIAIRTAVVKGNMLFVQAAAGIVADSIAESEWKETEVKARAVLRAAEQVEDGFAAGPPAHVADTEDNRPYARRRDVVQFLRTGDLSIPRSYDADWLVIDRERSVLRPALPVVHADERYLLYRL